MSSTRLSFSTTPPSPPPHKSPNNGIVRLFDCDVNLTHTSLLSDIPSLLGLASIQGVSAAIVPGSNLVDSIHAIDLCVQHSGKHGNIQLFATVGVHPFHASTEPKTSLKTLESLLSGNDAQIIKAVGETGLDTSPSFPRIEDQIYWMEEQVELAVRLRLPLFLHERDAHEPFMRILRRYGKALPPCLIHCFTGSEYELKTYLNAGFYISISGMICKESTLGFNLRQVVAACDPPRHRLLVETDAPYMGFPGCRATMESNPSKEFPNVPQALPAVVQELAKILNRPVEQVARDSYEAACEFFQCRDKGFQM